MARKRKSEMTSVELIDQALRGRTWEEAETAGVEIIARCMALHAYARKEGHAYIEHIMERICMRADDWAHEDGNPVYLAFARVGHEITQMKQDK